MPKNKSFQTIITEGALLPPDILQQVAALEIIGTQVDDYHLLEGTKLNEAITQSWTSLQAQWKAFREARENLPENDTGTTTTNEKWLLPLFQQLGYGRLTTVDAPTIEDKSYPIRRFYNNSPIHFIGCNLPLDRRSKGIAGAATASPHAMVQEFLNRSEDHLWAFLSNGLSLRLLRDNVSLSRQAYLEFDIAAMMDGEVYSDFALLWLVCHQSRIEADKASECWLEKWAQLAQEQGTRILNKLRSGVEKAIEALGQGFISQRRNDQLISKLKSGELSKDDFYRQLLRIVYRLLFLFVAEDRELLHPVGTDPATAELYDRYYSTRRLRDMSERLRGSKHCDLWHSLSLVFDALGRDEGCPQLALAGLGSFLWRSRDIQDRDKTIHQGSTRDLLGPAEAREGTAEPVYISNDDLLRSIRALAFVVQDKTLRAVDYRNLGSEELGSVYESLLELNPQMHIEARTFSLTTAAGNERKTSGSYYTPDSLVQCLLDSALEPVVEQRLKDAKQISRNAFEQLPDWIHRIPEDRRDVLTSGRYAAIAEQAILALTVCDPASGSGHFLIAAAHRLARHLARVRTGESEPSPEDHQHALRNVIARCIFGVDINPMAVELCKVSLWMEAIEPGKPLSFLDHHILCGNSLIGTTPALLEKGIPDEAYNEIEGDVKSQCTHLRNRNKTERKDIARGQTGFAFEPVFKMGNLPAEFAKLASSDDDSVDQVAAKERHFAQLVKNTNYLNARLLADTWCAVFVWKKDESELGTLCPTERDFRRIENNPHSILPHVKEEVQRLAQQYQFFHWHIAFPEAFVLPEVVEHAQNRHTGWSRGFDLVVGNPPWEKIKIQEKEWFASRVPEIATAPNAAARRRLILELEKIEPSIFSAFIEDKRSAEAESHFLRNSARYPLCGRGDVNTYSVFSELSLRAISPLGRAGCIVPPGILTDDTNKAFAQEVVNEQHLVIFFDFTNRGYIFSGVESTMSFSLMVIAGENQQFFTLTAQLWNVSDVNDQGRRLRFTRDDVEQINPNTLTLPILRSAVDAELVKYIYNYNPVAVREPEPAHNRWSLKFTAMLHSSGESDQFFTRNQLANLGSTLHGNVFSSGESTFVPLYESKLAGQYNHRAGTFDESHGEEMFRTRAATRTPNTTELQDPNFVAIPRYWVQNQLVEEHIPREWTNDWLVGYRRTISAVADARSVNFFLLPRCGATDSIFLVYCGLSVLEFVGLVSGFNSFIFDYVARQKASGGNLSFYVFKQLPVLSRDKLEPKLGFIQSRTLLPSLSGSNRSMGSRQSRAPRDVPHPTLCRRIHHGDFPHRQTQRHQTYGSLKRLWRSHGRGHLHHQGHYPSYLRRHANRHQHWRPLPNPTQSTTRPTHRHRRQFHSHG